MSEDITFRNCPDGTGELIEKVAKQGGFLTKIEWFRDLLRKLKAKK